MKLFKLALFFLFFLFAFSCDISSFAEVVNKSNKTIIVEILYDRDELKQVPGLKPIKPYFSNQAQLISFDSLSMIGKLKIEPKDSLQICSNRGSKPGFKFIKKLKIFADDTVVLSDRNKIINSFKETSPRVFTYEIN